MYYGTQLYESTDDMADVAASFHRLALHVRGTGEDHESKMDLSALPLDSKGFASDFFVKLTQDESLMSLVNVCNEWALFLIGLGLTLGCLYRLASVGGMILLAMYTLSHPSFIGATYLQPFEGSYLWIDKNLVELAALGLLCVFPTSQIIGFDRVLGRVCPILHKLKFI